MNKNDLTEYEIRTRCTLPAIRQVRWKSPRVRDEVDTPPLHGKCVSADCVVYHHAISLAIVEAKGNNHPVGGGMQQALTYARVWDAPFAYSINGDAFLERDLLSDVHPIERTLSPGEFPSDQRPLCLRIGAGDGIDTVDGGSGAAAVGRIRGRARARDIVIAG